MRRLLLVGDLRPHTRTAQRARAFARLGWDVFGVTTVPLDEAAPGGARPSLASRIRHRLGLPADVARTNERLLELARQESPELVLVEKALPLRTATLRSLRSAAPWLRLGFFTEDDVLLPGNRSRWFRSSLPLYDEVFTTKSFHLENDELAGLGARRVHYVPKTFDPDLHRPVEVSAEDAAAFGGPVGFIGTFEEERARALLSLARAGLAVRVFGNGWDHWTRRHPMLRIEGRAIYGSDYVKALCATDVNLGFLRRSSRDRHTDRSVEIPACGAFLLAERTDEHRALFEEDREAAYFGDMVELAAKVHHYLRMPSERLALARAGRLRALSSDYSHDAGLRIVLESLVGPQREERAA